MAVAAAPRHATTRRVGRRSARLAAALFGLLLAVAAVAAQRFVLSPAESATPLVYRGQMGDMVDTTRFSARVLSAKTARAIEVPDSGDYRAIPTEHLFLIVEAAATVPREPMKLAASLRTADGKTYHATDKVDVSRTLAYTWIQPGWWSSGVYIFEVPRQALPGARVVVHLPSELITDIYAPQAEIDLGLDDHAAKALADAAVPTHRLGSVS